MLSRLYFAIAMLATSLAEPIDFSSVVILDSSLASGSTRLAGNVFDNFDNPTTVGFQGDSIYTSQEPELTFINFDAGSSVSVGQLLVYCYAANDRAPRTSELFTGTSSNGPWVSVGGVCNLGPLPTAFWRGVNHGDS